MFCEGKELRMPRPLVREHPRHTLLGVGVGLARGAESPAHGAECLRHLLLGAMPVRDDALEGRGGRSRPRVLQGLKVMVEAGYFGLSAVN